jgi:hypothetical protein
MDQALLVIGTCLLILGAALFVRARRANRIWWRDKMTVGVLVLGVTLLVAGLATWGTPERDVASRRPADDTRQQGEYDGPDAGPDNETGPDTATLSPEDAYSVEIITVNQEMAGQLDDLTRALLTADYEDATWVANTKATLSAMNVTAEKARAIRAPDSHAAVHEAWMEGIESYDWAATNMATAIDGPDYALMERCNVRFEDASKSFERATMLLQRLGTP